MKRSVPVFFCVMLTFAFLMLRLWSVMIREEVNTGLTGNSITVEVASSRGYIYDRNMSTFVNTARKNVAVVAPVPHTVTKIKEIADENSFIFAIEKLSKGIPAVVTVRNTVHVNGITNLSVPIRYSGDFLLPHIAGYCDGAGKGVSGLEKGYESLLSERTFRITYKVDANGRVLCGAEKKIVDEGINSPRGVVLTLDKDLQEIVRRQLKNSKINKGAAVLMDVGSGEILSMVSVPEYNIYDIKSSLNDNDAPFINRALTAVSIGSVYKTVVAAAALENGISEDFEYECTGNTVQSSVTFHCHNRSGHGNLQMKDALSNSCNTWFINMAKNIEIERITELSFYMGLGTELELAPGLISEKGIVPDVSELDSDAARANIAFGQGRLTATPIQIAAMTAVFANKGIYTEPKLIVSIIGDDGIESKTDKSFSQRVISEKNAEKIRKMMVYSSEVTKKMTFKDCGGKTATAENGVYIDGKEQFNTWYSGFFPAEEPKYVLTVFCENGDSGATDCMPVFEKTAIEILSKIQEKY